MHMSNVQGDTQQHLYKYSKQLKYRHDQDFYHPTSVT